MLKPCPPAHDSSFVSFTSDTEWTRSLTASPLGFKFNLHLQSPKITNLNVSTHGSVSFNGGECPAALGHRMPGWPHPVSGMSSGARVVPGPGALTWPAQHSRQRCGSHPACGGRPHSSSAHLCKAFGKSLRTHDLLLSATITVRVWLFLRRHEPKSNTTNITKSGLNIQK